MNGISDFRSLSASGAHDALGSGGHGEGEGGRGGGRGGGSGGGGDGNGGGGELRGEVARQRKVQAWVTTRCKQLAILCAGAALALRWRCAGAAMQPTCVSKWQCMKQAPHGSRRSSTLKTPQQATWRPSMTLSAGNRWTYGGGRGGLGGRGGREGLLLGGGEGEGGGGEGFGAGATTVATAQGGGGEGLGGGGGDLGDGGRGLGKGGGGLGEGGGGLGRGGGRSGGGGLVGG